ncbi:hypothetical protein ID741_003560 [Enterococcus sp. AZ103]
MVQIALRNDIDKVVTRNFKDFEVSDMIVYSPDEIIGEK